MKINITLAAFYLLGTIACKQNPPAEQAAESPASGIHIERNSAELDAILAPDAKVEVLAEGFQWTEGPVWIDNGDYLLFSDIPPNKIMRWKEGEGVSLYLTPSGFTSGGTPPMSEPGSNGLLLDANGRLVLCQHGDRRIAAMNAPLEKPAPQFVTLADKWNGKRFNSPNDAVFDRNGNLYLTDPPYGLPKHTDDPGKEIPFQGVFMLHPDGKLDLLLDSLSRPNGIALSPDEKTLYVANSDPEKALWMSYQIEADGKLTNGKVFYDATSMVSKHKGLPDGLKVNGKGIVFATGPGGVWIFKPDGQLLGRIDTGQATANCAFGKDGKVLYMTADDYLMRVKLQ